MIVDHKTIAAHFEKTNEAMRKLSKSGSGLYTIYVKAYLYDTVHGSDPLYLICDRERYESIKPTRVHRLSVIDEVRIDEVQHRVGHKVGDKYRMQQFGNLDQAEEAYNAIRENR